MKEQSVVSEYIDSLCASKRLGSQVVFSHILDRVPARLVKTAGLFPSSIPNVIFTNPEILKKHLGCAASELPSRVDESLLASPEAKKAVSFLESDGSLLRSREDATPGGIGLTRAAFERAEELIENIPLPDAPVGSRMKIKLRKKTYWGVLDIETRRSAKEVGGWSNAHRMGVSCAILYDSRKDDYLTFFEEDIPGLVDHLQRFDFVVGFNIKKFDYRVLSGIIDFKFSLIETIDILEHIHARLGYRLSLNHVATATLGAKKSADGLAALRWWKEGRMDEIVAYCKKDVEVTKDIFLYGHTNGYLLFTNKAGHTVRIPVDWASGQGASAA